MKIVHPKRRWEYVLAIDRESDAKTVFVLRRLTWEELNEVQAASPFTAEQALAFDRLTAQARSEKRDPTPAEIEALNQAVPNWMRHVGGLVGMHAVACRYGLEEVRGLLDEKGNPLKVDSAEFIRIAPREAIAELGAEIFRISTLSEDEAKN